MLTIRLKSEGKKHQKTMRIVVVDSRKSSISNRYIEKIGWWIPADHKYAVNKERALYWISKGAKPSTTVHNLLIEEKIIEGNKIPKHNHSEKAIEAKNKKDNPEVVKTENKEEKKEIKEETKPEVAEEIKTEEISEATVTETQTEEAENSQTTN